MAVPRPCGLRSDRRLAEKMDGVKFLRFSHAYSSTVWGGDGIRRRYGRTDAPDPCAESWEISAHPAGRSVVRGGKFDGVPLDELATRLGAGLVGTKAPDATKFPLLFKVIDARLPLSVQVHPNEKTAPLTGGEPKSEAWYVLGCSPGSTLYAGLRNPVGVDVLRDAVHDGNAIADFINCIPVSEGDFLYIPGGTPHSIGRGLMIYEVQQSSNTTYRLYDWGRVGADGRPRALHVEEALKSINCNAAPPLIRRGSLETPYFKIREIVLREPLRLVADGSSFIAVFVASGVLTEAGEGESLLLPAAGGEMLMKPAAPNTRVLVTTL